VTKVVTIHICIEWTVISISHADASFVFDASALDPASELSGLFGVASAENMRRRGEMSRVEVPALNVGSNAFVEVRRGLFLLTI
jgi:hypothetical protein